MKNLLFAGWLALILLMPGGSVFAQNTKNKELLKNFVFMDLKYGRVVIKLYPKKAPKHVERVKTLIREKFYDGLKFHRVIDRFMAQTGDPTGAGNGGSRYPDLPAEFSKKETFKRGTVGAARANDINSANSQFFICYEAAPWLNGKYTIWGEVVKGMKYLDLINKGHPRTGAVPNPDIIISMKLAYDDPKDRKEKK